jgi:phosphoglycerol transferase MdoB-like AlkP superfamily enzyme
MHRYCLVQTIKSNLRTWPAYFAAFLITSALFKSFIICIGPLILGGIPDTPHYLALGLLGDTLAFFFVAAPLLFVPWKRALYLGLYLNLLVIFIGYNYASILNTQPSWVMIALERVHDIAAAHDSLVGLLSIQFLIGELIALAICFTLLSWFFCKTFQNLNKRTAKQIAVCSAILIPLFYVDGYLGGGTSSAYSKNTLIFLLTDYIKQSKLRREAPEYFSNQSNVEDFKRQLYDQSLYQAKPEAGPLGRSPVLSQHELHPEIKPSKNYNVVFFVLESMSQEALRPRYRGVKLAPNFRKILDQSLSFEHFYSTWGLSIPSYEGIFYSSPSLIMDLRQKKRENSVSLIDILNRNNYHTAAFTSYRDDFVETDYLFENLLANRLFYSLRDYEKTHEIKDEDRHEFGVHDHLIIQEMQEWINSYNQSKPFFITFFGSSSHAPFDPYPNNSAVKKIFPGQPGPEAMFNIYNYELETVASFINALKASGKLDNTVIVITGDHRPPVFGFPEFNKMGNYQGRFREHQVPFIIYAPQTVKPVAQLESRPGSQIDIPSTLLHLLGLNEGTTTFTGQSLLLKNFNQDRLIPFEEGAIIDHHGVDAGEAWSLDNTGRPLQKLSLLKVAPFTRRYQKFQEQLLLYRHLYQDHILKDTKIAEALQLKSTKSSELATTINQTVSLEDQLFIATINSDRPAIIYDKSLNPQLPLELLDMSTKNFSEGQFVSQFYGPKVLALEKYSYLLLPALKADASAELQRAHTLIKSFSDSITKDLKGKILHADGHETENDFELRKFKARHFEAINFPTESLPHVTGQVSSKGSLLASESTSDKPGYLSYGPYTWLPKGVKVRALLSYSTSMPADAPIEHHWDMTYWTKYNEVPIVANGDIPNTGGKIRTLEIEITPDADLKWFEMRNHYSGKGDFEIFGLRIEPIR